MSRLQRICRERLGRVLPLLHATLQEIFDESAYARFLLQHNLENSPDSYRHYLQESDTHRQRRPRCC